MLGRYPARAMLIVHALTCSVAARARLFVSVCVRVQFATPWVPTQPEWSALREYAYGHGQLHILNSTHARWEWIRDDDPWNPSPSTAIGDETFFIRQSSDVVRC